MKIFRVSQTLNLAINDWLTQPEKNAAGRVGLFRIIYALFYLWHLSTESSVFLSGLPGDYVHSKVYLVRYFFRDFGASLPPYFFNSLESLLAASLILLAFGYKTRIATAFVLSIGATLEALSASVDGQRTLVVMAFYIPFFMLLSNGWGDTYSLDALLNKRNRASADLSVRKGQVNPHDTSWRYFLPARALLVMFSALFLSSAVFKMGFGGAWLTRFDLMSNLVLNRNIEATLYDLPLNWFAPYISQTPLIYISVHIATLIFEGCFFLTLVNRKLRSLLISLALIFHSVNALWLIVTVTPILIGYCLFIDWQSIKDFIWPKQVIVLTEPSPQWLVPIALFLATATGLLWHSELAIYNLFNLGGLLTWRTLWYPVLPVSVYWFALTVLRLFQKEKGCAL